MRRIILALMAGAATIASPAVAATTVDFTASGITTLVGPDAPPVTSANGTFAYDYAGGNALTLTAFSLNIGSAHFGLADVASTFNSLNDALQIGGLANGGINNLLGTTNDFTLSLTFNPLTGSGSSGAFNFTTASTNSFFQSSSVSSAAAVPEPATWAMMLLGFGGIGFAMRRGRKQNPRLLQIA
jgi:hypothetical protein